MLLRHVRTSIAGARPGVKRVGINSRQSRAPWPQITRQRSVEWRIQAEWVPVSFKKLLESWRETRCGAAYRDGIRRAAAGR